MKIQMRLAPPSRRSVDHCERSQSGFTLIEILVVITILAILATIVLMAIFNGQTTSAQSTCRSDYKTVETAVEAYKVQIGNYPSGSAAIAGTAPHTDDESGTPPDSTVGLGVGAGIVNAAGSATSELMVAGDTVPNTFPGAVGPWLKDVPTVSAHFHLFVANDGTGHILVLDDTGKVVGAGVNSSYSMADCSSVK